MTRLIEIGFEILLDLAIALFLAALMVGSHASDCTAHGEPPPAHEEAAR